MMKKILSMSLAIVFAFVMNIIPAGKVTAETTSLPAHIAIGYWENWTTGPNIRLGDVDSRWDVIIVSFMLTEESDNCTNYFAPDPTLYPDGDSGFIADVKYLQSMGKKVLIAFGGAVGYKLDITTAEKRDTFYISARNIIEKYGFDGWDIDIEQSILSNGPLFADTCLDKVTENSMINPVRPTNVNLIWICRELESYFGEDFMLTMAPEHPYVQGGAFWWGGYNGFWGAYLPLINAVRDILDFVHVQLYNNGFADYDLSSLGYDVPADGYNAETYIAMCDLLIDGFDIAPNQWFDVNVQPDIVANTEHFDGLRPDQVALGVVSEGHGSGELSPTEYADIVDKLTAKYPDFRGFMTWSIGNIAKNGLDTLDAVRPVIDKYNALTPTEPTPTEPMPTEPTPTEPMPTEPTPTEPTPTEPTPTEPTPTEPTPTEPTPTKPTPTEPTPTEPTPTEPVFGDVNSDGVLTVADVVTLKRFVMGDGTIDIENADLSGDSKVNSVDMALLKNIIFATNT